MQRHATRDRLRAPLAGLAGRLKLRALPEGPRRSPGFLFLDVRSWQCLTGPALVLHARALGIERRFVSVLFSLPCFAGCLGLPTRPPAGRHGSKRVLMAGWSARNLPVLPIILTPVPLRCAGPGAAAVLLFVTISLFCITRVLAGVAWSSWLHEIVPPVQLGRFA